MRLFRRTILVLVAFALVAAPAAAKDQARVPTIDDLLHIDAIGSVRISPNGKWVAYAVTYSDFQKDAFVTHLWIAHPASGRKYQLTRGDKSAGDMAWSPDSSWQAFTSDRAATRDVLTRLPTTAAGQLGDLLPDRWQAARQAETAKPPSSATHC
jgi:dipeptidyl aminopeptidase/acylaminoacyl peptidase